MNKERFLQKERIMIFSGFLLCLLTVIMFLLSFHFDSYFYNLSPLMKTVFLSLPVMMIFVVIFLYYLLLKNMIVEINQKAKKQLYERKILAEFELAPLILILFLLIFGWRSIRIFYLLYEYSFLVILYNIFLITLLIVLLFSIYKWLQVLKKYSIPLFY